jgi:hypothetical protein
MRSPLQFNNMGDRRFPSPLAQTAVSVRCSRLNKAKAKLFFLTLSNEGA